MVADLFDPRRAGAHVTFEGRVRRLLPRRTALGAPWAIAGVMTHVGPLDCLIFPTTFSGLDEAPKPGHFYLVNGRLAHRYGPLVQVISIHGTWQGLKAVT